MVKKEGGVPLKGNAIFILKNSSTDNDQMCCGVFFLFLISREERENDEVKQGERTSITSLYRSVDFRGLYVSFFIWP
jgi:hypothetical protein